MTRFYSGVKAAGIRPLTAGTGRLAEPACRTSRQTGTGQHHGQRRGVRQAHLVVGDRPAGRHQLVAGRDDRDARQARDAHAAPTGRGEHRRLGTAEPGAGCQQRGTLPVIAGATVDELAALRQITGLEADRVAVARVALDRHHGVGAGRQRRTGHDLDGTGRVLERHRGLAGETGPGDREFAALTPEAQRDAVHHHAVERWLVAFGFYDLGQHAAGDVVNGDRLIAEPPGVRDDRRPRLGDADHPSPRSRAIARWPMSLRRKQSGQPISSAAA